MKRMLFYIVVLNFPVFGDSLKETPRETHPILGGQAITPGMFKSVVYVNVPGAWCTGTIVDSNWILTAGHCVARGGGVGDVQSIAFGRGEDYQQSTRKIGRIILHPQYRSSGIPGFEYDAALVEILEPAPEEFPSVQILSREEEDQLLSSDAQGIMIGYGYTGGSYPPNSPHWVEAPIQTPEDCVRDRGVDPEIAHEHTLCAGTDKIMFRSGDSGGPLLIPISSSILGKQSYAHAGIASIRGWDPQGDQTVSVYARTSSIYDWIQGYISAPRIFPHVFTGNLGRNNSWTEATITNRTSQPCSVDLTFSQGTQGTSTVYFNNQVYPENRLTLSIPPGSTQSIEITSPGGEFIHGSLYIEEDCPLFSLNIQGRYLIQDPQGEIQEVFSISPETSQDWLEGGRCKILASKFGNGRDVGLAFVTSRKGVPAPSGTQLTFKAYTWQGAEAESLSAIPVTGRKTALNPWELEEPRMVEICLDIPEPDSLFRLAIIAVGAKATLGKVQYFTEDLIEP